MNCVVLCFSMECVYFLMFDENGAMKIAKTKSVLKNNLKVEVPRRNTDVDASFLDGCAVLWVARWWNYAGFSEQFSSPYTKPYGI